ncbi:carboxypeptidase regulatory-like domain-containing protein [Deinococcus sp. Arct2-2]|uniref:carboxypeptidase-like regulatory domain-containing protein n=1 Tax=Deinococcus sp. Arct2-2 TaxID=2568653 RepID=UPI0010A4F9AA|nr:carboxypeptidase-like regulatory domain-containing protein [Deinococcus sp. Arct2-2]THF70894.1 carboxypeptidase regulatory-like domain-containing protein [Deinococcus sp. Arct2-2]
MTKPAKRSFSITTLLALSLVSCSNSSGSMTPPTTPPGDTDGTGGGPSSAPNTVSGQVLNSQGKPIAGALIWVRPAVTTGLVTVHTNAQGQYQSPTLVNVPYRTYGYVQTEYQGQPFCLRLAANQLNEYDAFSPNPSGTVVRNFKLQLSGKIPDATIANTYFGAEVRLMHHTWRNDQQLAASDSAVEVTLVPDGALIDGSVGQTLVRSAKVGENFLYDIPIGHYNVTATEVHRDGTRTPLVLGEYQGPPASQTTLDFSASGGCGGSTSNVSRAFLYVARP